MNLGAKVTSRRQRVVSLTTIPTPYRVHFFGRLKEELQRKGWDYEVYFMANTEPRRHWRMDPHDWDFTSRMGRGFSPRVASQIVHLQPDLVATLAFDPPDLLFMSGGWFHPTNQLSLWLLKLLANTKIFFWSESNLEWVRHPDGLVGSWRSLTYRGFDGFVVPGSMAKEYLDKFTDSTTKPIVYLPNLVDETVYSKQVSQLRRQRVQLRDRFRIPADRHVMLAVCRLAPIKGILPLVRAVSALPDALRDSLMLLIAGEGNQRHEISAFIHEQNLHQVRLLGHVQEDTLAQLYALSDGFVLPSLGDPYPLSTIEASFAGLPLLLSNRVGSHPEILRAGENGWLFDPHRENSIIRVLTDFLAKTKMELRQMGSVSAQIAHSDFRTDSILPEFVTQLLWYAK